MPDVFEVADKLVDHIKANYPDDVALAAYYGSYAQGTATERSDLDFFFIPATARGYEASLQFILDDISFDFWPISWERAERMAAFQEAKTSIIADCKLLYARSDEDRGRLLRLQEGIVALQSPEHEREFVEKAEAELSRVYARLYKLIRAGDFGSGVYSRTEAAGILEGVLQGLALLNQSCFTRGFGQNKDQIHRLPLKPALLDSYMHAIMHGDQAADILHACERLAEDTVALISARKERLKGTPSFGDRMKGFYEEEKGILDKIQSACERNDYDTAYFHAVKAQDNIAAFLCYAETGQWPSDLKLSADHHDLYRQAGLPELVPLLDPHDLTRLQAGAERLSVVLESYLRSKGVEINRFSHMASFEAFLKDASAKEK
ncbi:MULTISPECIES: nucleotidyltransferase domain-containing protein [unclassified Paenibacillus]|uniref:nucleotidyltransferase domain-containing protein n=1 Tax=unclassified Paenibacillus TaxID=185978 RepID=UPI0009540998|nr:MULTISPECIES: nucleotidyltransferase domain-containing protein [unclassified Paenibacillus]ASS67026.1 hypothetical protein CIC07_13445 [Paenibacillus sp. RUD330]SIR48684.1 Nucleotidyltransferase domain-containing protein [Paenibacillus sp. RU4X]SIR58025.1 Nucleotidyltransferase domain-containing protein [Paenibacillus sp. RU4T]